MTKNREYALRVAKEDGISPQEYQDFFRTSRLLYLLRRCMSVDGAGSRRYQRIMRLFRKAT